MTVEEAVYILKKHNEWRRETKYPSKAEMISPKIVGIAIDTIVEHNEKSKSKPIS